MEQDLENPALSLVLEPAEEPAEATTAVSMPPAVPEKTLGSAWLDDTGIEIVRATRSWIQYGTVGFAVLCIIIGAVEALLGR
ncbi:MAG: hypothetical protein ACLPWF_32010 [Bryobacteraceae bacterium]